MNLSPRIFSFILFLFLAFFSTRVKAQDTVKYKVVENFKREIIIENKRYRVYDNWVNVGIGGAYHSENPKTQLVLGIDFNFHIKKPYFQAGFFISGDDFGGWNNYQLHMGYIPFRRNNEKRQQAISACISYSRNYTYAYPGHYFSRANDDVGVYLTYQFICKLDYSTGFGLMVFADINKRNIITGIRVEGFLSGGYKGYVKGKGPTGQ
jgi:hypothetical protein